MIVLIRFALSLNITNFHNNCLFYRWNPPIEKQSYPSCWFCFVLYLRYRWVLHRIARHISQYGQSRSVRRLPDGVSRDMNIIINNDFNSEQDFLSESYVGPFRLFLQLLFKIHYCFFVKTGNILDLIYRKSL